MEKSGKQNVSKIKIPFSTKCLISIGICFNNLLGKIYIILNWVGIKDTFDRNLNTQSV